MSLFLRQAPVRRMLSELGCSREFDMKTKTTQRMRAMGEGIRAAAASVASKWGIGDTTAAAPPPPPPPVRGWLSLCVPGVQPCAAIMIGCFQLHCVNFSCAVIVCMCLHMVTSY